MLLAIDVGNTHTVFGLWDNENWVARWRRPTRREITEDDMAVWLESLFALSKIPWKIDAAACVSVVPHMNHVIDRFCEQWMQVRCRFLESPESVGVAVQYDPPTSVGPDRLANVLGCLSRYEPPMIVVDCGTATTFDVIDPDGKFIGGAIMPGLSLSAKALFEHAPRLHPVELIPPESVVAQNTIHALQSGLMYGYAGAIDGMIARMRAELGFECKVIATGGIGGLLIGLCDALDEYDPSLTLDGLVEAARRWGLWQS